MYVSVSTSDERGGAASTSDSVLNLHFVQEVGVILGISIISHKRLLADPVPITELDDLPSACWATYLTSSTSGIIRSSSDEGKTARATKIGNNIL